MFHGSILVLLLTTHNLMMMVMAGRRPQLQPPRLRLIQRSSRKPDGVLHSSSIKPDKPLRLEDLIILLHRRLTSQATRQLMMGVLMMPPSSNRSPGSCSGIAFHPRHVTATFHSSVLVLLLPSHHLILMTMASSRDDVMCSTYSWSRMFGGPWICLTSEAPAKRVSFDDDQSQQHSDARQQAAHLVSHHDIRPI